MVQELVAPEIAAPDGSPRRSFILAGQTKEVRELIEDFERYSSRKQWEQAFRSLEAFLAKKPSGLIEAPDGFHIAAQQRIWRAVAALPADGKNAYRLFYDGIAKKLLEEAHDKDELAGLNEIYASYFATSVGDVAANRLGEYYFEQGDWSKAADCWQSVLDYHPTSTIPRLELLTKAAIARLRAEQLDEFHRIARVVRERFAGETVVLGGKSVPAAAHLAALVNSQGQPSAVTSAVQTPDDVTLPDANEPAWQLAFLSEVDRRTIGEVMQNFGGNPGLITELVPPSVADTRRVYVNLLGYHFAIDLMTGKLAWRNARFTEIGGSMQERAQQLAADAYGIAASAGRVYFVSRPVAATGRGAGLRAVLRGGGDGGFRLLCVNPDDGKSLWDSSQVAGAKDWQTLGTPLVVGDRVFVSAIKAQQSTNLHLLALQAKDGKLLWATSIGTFANDQMNQYGFGRTFLPMLAANDGMLFADTQLGTVVQVNATSGELAWAFDYETEPPDPPYYYGNQFARLLFVAAPIARGGKLYFKGAKSDRLHAIDPSVPKLDWRRPVSTESMLLDVDDDRLLLVGQETIALRAAVPQPMHWSVTLPVVSSGSRPVVTRNRVYGFTARGIFELDKATGDRIRIFRGNDLDSSGGSILLTPSRLVTVSNVAITAYPIVPRPTAGPNRSESARP